MIKLLLALFIFLTSCEKQTPKETIRPVKAIQVQDTSLADNSIIFPGTLRAFKRADLSFRVDGVVMIRDISVGQEIKKDEVLIRLDPREYKIALNKAKAKVRSVLAQLEFSTRDLSRMKRIYESDSGAISESLVDRKQETNNQLQAELSISQSELEKATDDLLYTRLKAPFDGVVSAIYVENHEQVRAKQTVLRLIDTAEREMEIHIPQKYMNTLLRNRSNLTFEVHLDFIPDRTFAASLKEIGLESSSTTQTYPVTLTLKDVPYDLSLLSGMSGRAILQQNRVTLDQSVFKIQRTALFTDNLKQSYVWVVNPNSQVVSKRPVKLEENNIGNFAMVKEGITAGEWVVTAGTSFLSEGQQVKLVPEQSGS